MKYAIFLAAAIALVAAFDFPEEWEAWKTVSSSQALIIVIGLHSFAEIR